MNNKLRNSPKNYLLSPISLKFQSICVSYKAHQMSLFIGNLACMRWIILNTKG